MQGLTRAALTALIALAAGCSGESAAPDAAAAADMAAAAPAAASAEGDAAAPAQGDQDFDAAAAQGTFTLERGACFGPCPIYSASVFADDRLIFVGEKFVAREGAHEKRLPAGSFARLVAIALAHDFAALNSAWPDEAGLACPEPATDMPTTSVALATPTIDHRVSFYEGCAGFPGAPAIVAMIAEIDAVLALDDWIGPREAWLGGKKR